MRHVRFASTRLMLALFLLTFLACGPTRVFAADTPGPSGQLPATTTANNPLADSFLTPPETSKPWAYWWWLNANVTKESITHELEGMKAKGLGGFLLFDVTAYGHELVPPPERHIDFMSPEWRELVHFAMQEADRLGLQMSMNLSTCGGALQAPWSMGEHSPKQLIFTSIDVTGPTRVTCRLKKPESEFFWPVAVVAARHADSPKQTATDNPAAASNPVTMPDAWTPIFKTGHRAASLVLPKDATLVNEVIDLTAKVDAAGQLTWDVPKGKWTLLRFGCEPISGRDKDVDILNTEAVEDHFDRMAKTILKDAGPLAGKTLTHFYNVSWEGTAPSWTPGFEQDFLKYRGYNVRPYLPILAGMVVDNRDVSERFQGDYCRTLSDCFRHNCYQKFTELCHEAGVRWHAESGGPWLFRYPLFSHGDQFAFWGVNDMPQGEFWWPSKTHTNARRTAMAAHIYGKPIVSIEAFTHMRAHWSAYPASLKPFGDAAFCDGMNQFVWHTSSASPKEFGKPGIVYFAGTHLNPNITWWDKARPFLDYLTRCQHMLRQGKFVADVCCYTSDRNRKNWGRDEKWGEKTSLELPKGYTYDLLNTEVLLNRLSVDDGDLVLPDGMRYRLLVVDLEEEIIPPQAIAKIIELAEAGATVVLGPRRPTRAPGLTDFPAADDNLARLATKLWGEQTQQPSTRNFGRGKVIAGTAMADVLQAEHILPDCDGPFDYIHRHGDDFDAYFLSGTGDAECTFRTAGKQPELWDATTGQQRAAVHYRTTDDGRTIVPLSLPENGSVFVVFRNPIRQPHLIAIEGPAAGMEIVDQTDATAQVRFWQPGRYVLTTSQKKQLPIDVAELPKPQTLSGPWNVDFLSGMGAPESTVFDQLVAWNEHPDPAIKYYSGTAVYRRSFDLDSKQAAGLVRLQLGQAKNIVRVRLNGKDLGVVWTAPWTVDLTGLVNSGKNDLEVEVTNLWVNRLIGDADLPPEKRFTKTNVALQKGKRTLRVFQGFGSTDPLETSGLLGPVQLEFGQQRDVSL